jgi:long-subunit acyl-CoA synthetase (AMP-forming)
VLLLSARLSPAAAQHLLRETSARALIHSTRLAYKAKELSLASQKQGDGQIRSYAAKDTHFWFNSTNGDVDTSQSICQPGYDGGDSDRNVLILHSSGTTGLPKPIYTSHKYLLSFVTCHAFSSEDSAKRLNVSTLPLYHVRPIPYTVLR